ncbi:MAG TPA: hypothetical protein VF177_17230 [Anaerolineae bacterium]
MSELENFVLGYLEQVGSIVEPAAYGVHEVLLPEAVAERLGTAAYQQIAFDEVAENGVTRLGYNHPLVEQMVQEVHDRPASARTYVNGLRLDKSGLEDLAAKTWVVLNGRVIPRPRTTPTRVRSTYVRFNFKVAILSHEKQEQLISVLMDAHSGYRIAHMGPIEGRANATEPDQVLQSLSDAPIQWRPPSGESLKDPLDQCTLEALLERAKTAVLDELAKPLNALQKRVSRFRDLDVARLSEYYDELERDLQQRLKNASPDRRASLTDKIAAVKTERAHKLADVNERYQVRLNLTLLNLMVIQQAKLALPVNIENRTTKIKLHAVWDPLKHELEPLACKVCGLPSQRSYLCYNGHLAHEDCLAPACIDCKRVFCQQCAHEIGECDVCHEPLCRHSRIVCDVCGRGTCQAHLGLCHASDGEPVDLAAKAPPSPEPEPTPPPATQPKPGKKANTKTRRSKPTPTKSKPASDKSAWPKGVPKPQRIEIVVHSNAVAAHLLASRERQVAVRIWELIPSDGGIVRTCDCEKGEVCKANNIVIRPSEWQPIEAQIMQEIAALRQEYGLPAKKVKFNRVSSLDGQFIPMPQFKLFGLWKEETALAEARTNFERLYWK